MNFGPEKKMLRLSPLFPVHLGNKSRMKRISVEIETASQASRLIVSPKCNFGLSRRAKSIVRNVQRDKQTKAPRNRRQNSFQTVKVRYFWRERRGVEFPCICLFLARLRIENIERENSKSASGAACTARAFTSKQLTLRLQNARRCRSHVCLAACTALLRSFAPLLGHEKLYFRAVKRYERPTDANSSREIISKHNFFSLLFIAAVHRLLRTTKLFS